MNFPLDSAFKKAVESGLSMLMLLLKERSHCEILSAHQRVFCSGEYSKYLFISESPLLQK